MRTITTIYEGTTGIQANDLIGRKLARDKGVNAAALIRDIKTGAGGAGTDQRYRACFDPVRADHRADGVRGRHALDARTTMTVDPREAAAGAVPYLKLTGTVTGGWQMARAARIAHHLLASGEENARFPARQDRYGAILCRACVAGGGAVA